MKKLFHLLTISFISILAIGQSTLRFDGINDYVNLGSSAANGVRTIEFWFKLDNAITPTNLTNTITLCGREVSSVNTNEWFINIISPGSSVPAGKLRFAIIPSLGNARDVVSDNNSWNANQWYHVAAVVHPIRGMMLFIDGVKQNDSLPNYTSATATMTQNLEIGRQMGFSRYFQGEIDDFHLSSSALYTSDFIPPCPDRGTDFGTIGLWNFNEQNGTLAIDSSNSALNGTIVGAIWDTSTVCNNKAQATLHFDGINDYVDLGANSGNGVRTIEFWFKPENSITPTNLSNTVTLCGREVSSVNTNEWFINIISPGSSVPPGKLRFAVIPSLGNAQDVVSDNNSWNANQWYHVAAVIHPIRGMMLFIDGVKQNDSLPNYTSATAAMIQPVEIGRQRGFSRYFEGNVEDFHLSSDALYTNNFTPPCPGLTPGPNTLALYNFNENRGSIAYDASSSMRDAIIYGPRWDSSFTCQSQPVGLDEIEGKNYLNDLSLYPNPSNGILFFSDVQELARLAIYGLDGQLIKEVVQFESNQIQFPEQSGMYILRIQTHSGEIIQKKVIRE